MGKIYTIDYKKEIVQKAKNETPFALSKKEKISYTTIIRWIELDKIGKLEEDKDIIDWSTFDYRRVEYIIDAKNMQKTQIVNSVGLPTTFFCALKAKNDFKYTKVTKAQIKRFSKAVNVSYDWLMGKSEFNSVKLPEYIIYDYEHTKPNEDALKRVHLSENVDTVLKSKGLSRRKLALKIGLIPQALSTQLRADDANPRFVQAIADECGVSYISLISD